jgi:hypothetical protein
MNLYSMVRSGGQHFTEHCGDAFNLRVSLDARGIDEWKNETPNSR